MQANSIDKPRIDAIAKMINESIPNFTEILPASCAPSLTGQYFEWYGRYYCASAKLRRTTKPKRLLMYHFENEKTSTTNSDYAMLRFRRAVNIINLLSPHPNVVKLEGAYLML